MLQDERQSGVVTQRSPRPDRPLHLTVTGEMKLRAPTKHLFLIIVHRKSVIIVSEPPIKEIKEIVDRR
jgi:hypothetical protein